MLARELLEAPATRRAIGNNTTPQLRAAQKNLGVVARSLLRAQQKRTQRGHISRIDKAESTLVRVSGFLWLLAGAIM